MGISSQAAWTAWVDQARNADILATAQSLGVRVKKNGTTEWTGPCPVCGGTDRFSITSRKRLFNCRSAA